MGRNINDLPPKAQQTKREAIGRATVVRAEVQRRKKDERKK